MCFLCSGMARSSRAMTRVVCWLPGLLALLRWPGQTPRDQYVLDVLRRRPLPVGEQGRVRGKRVVTQFVTPQSCPSPIKHALACLQLRLSRLRANAMRRRDPAAPSREKRTIFSGKPGHEKDATRRVGDGVDCCRDSVVTRGIFHIRQRLSRANLDANPRAPFRAPYSVTSGSLRLLRPYRERSNRQRPCRRE